MHTEITVKRFPKIDERDHKSDRGIYISTDGEENLGSDQQRLLDLSREIGWKKAVSSTISDNSFIEYLNNKDRLSVIDLLPLGEEHNILEIGPGYGQMTGALAQRVATVDVIEADIAQAHFCRIRFDQEGVDNVRVTAGGAEASLPYADNAFDGVVMNLVFEWCAIRSRLPHDQVQQAYLAEIARVLKPGGFLFLSTKNRFALRLLTGGRDEHMANKRFGSALPRAIGAALMGRARQHGYLHSFNALRRMIEHAGFSIEKPYWAVPDMRWPVRYVPFDDASVSETQRDPSLKFGGTRIHRLTKLLPATWVKHLAPGLVFLARRDPA